jgi:hypothetical protein
LQPTVVGLTIEGGPTIPPGESRQFSALATMSDRTTRDVTAEATWRLLHPAFRVDAGLVTASTFGEGFLTATYQNRAATLSVFGMPDETGILTGSIKEANFPVAAAAVEVVGGPFSGRRTVSDFLGSYRFYGVVGNLQIRVSHLEYGSRTLSVDVAPLANPRHDAILNFELTSLRHLQSLAGEYRATLRADGSCGATIPAEISERNYLATITQNGSRLNVVLSGAQFGTITPGELGNRFEGRARPDSVEFMLGSISTFYYYYRYYTWGLVERLDPPPIGPWGFVQGLHLAVFGTATGPASHSTISASINGTFSLYDAPSGFNSARRIVNSCTARNHQLTLTRQ